MQPFAASRDPITHIFWIRTKSPFRSVLVLAPSTRPMGATATAAAAADIDDDDVGSVILIFSDGVALLMSMVTVVAFNWSMSM